MLTVVALFLQVNAPVAATMMTLDSDDGAAICAVHQPAKGDPKAPLHRSETCSVCSICALGGPALLPTTDIAFASTPVANVALTIPREVAPRGPPARATRARDPPLTA